MEKSRLARALWIEISHNHIPNGFSASRLARALWIEISKSAYPQRLFQSRLARALWIEIVLHQIIWIALKVEARESLVD